MTTAWVLPGGASLGAVQAGLAEALLEAGIAPDLIVGTSVGALNGAWLAHRLDAEGLAALRNIWLGVRRAEVFPIRPWTILSGLAGRRDHLVPNDALRRWLEARLPFRRLEEATIPLRIVATDLVTGELVVLEEGDLVQALLASAAVPTIFPPVQVDGRWLFDGGVVANVPISIAAQIGADRVYVLPVGGPGEGPPSRPWSVAGVGYAALGISLSQAAGVQFRTWCERCEVYLLPAPPVDDVNPFSFRHSRRLMDEARAMASSWLPHAEPWPPRTEAETAVPTTGSNDRPVVA